MRWLWGALAVVFALVGFLFVVGRFLSPPPVAAPQAGVAIDQGLLFEGPALAAAVAEAGLQGRPLDTGALRITVPTGRGSPSPADRGVWIALSETAAFPAGAALRVEIDIADAVNVRAVAVSLQGRGAVVWEEALAAEGGAVANAPLPSTGPPERLGVFLVAVDPSLAASADLVRVRLFGLPLAAAEGARAPQDFPAPDEPTPTAGEEQPSGGAETGSAEPTLERSKGSETGRSGPWDATLEDL